jgi:hypothetical protein
MIKFPFRLTAIKWAELFALCGNWLTVVPAVQWLEILSMCVMMLLFVPLHKMIARQRKEC